MMKILLSLAILALLSTAAGAPAEWGMAINNQTHECAGFWGGDEFYGYSLPAGWGAYYPDYANSRISTPLGNCTWEYGREEACCRQLGLPFIAENIGEGSDTGLLADCNYWGNCTKKAYESCGKDSDCESGVCNCIKQDSKVCEPVNCTPGDVATDCAGIVVKRCSQDASWAGVENGEQTCKDNPACDLNKPCAGGLIRALRKDQYGKDCQESMAQMILPTVCIPCGNGICDDNESQCNCPEDCEGSLAIGSSKNPMDQTLLYVFCIVIIAIVVIAAMAYFKKLKK